MRFLLGILSLPWLLGFVSPSVAGNPYRRPSTEIYAPNYGLEVNNYYGSIGPYAPQYDPHTLAVERIKAAHSRARYYTHPLSQMNQPPAQVDYYGWGW